MATTAKKNVGGFVVWIAIFVVLIMGRLAYQGSKVEKVLSQAQVSTLQAPRQSGSPIAPTAQAEVWRQVQAGEWSLWVPILSKKISIAPASAQVEYECMFPDGTVVTRKPGPATDNLWQELIVSVRIRSNVNLLYRSTDL